MSRYHSHNSYSITSNNPVLYWMQGTQRYHDNHALDYAIKKANAHNVGLKVLFVLNGNYPDANARNMTFMLEGLKSLQNTLRNKGIVFTVEIGEFKTVLSQILENISMLVMDQSYLRHLRDIKAEIGFKATNNRIPCVSVESDVLVPVKEASDKAEYAARTIRKKLHAKLATYNTLPEMPPIQTPLPLNSASILDDSIPAIIKHLDVDESVPKSDWFKGGEDEAFKALDTFIHHRLTDYKNSNDPSKDNTSKMSMYLHFGMISPLRIYQTIQQQTTMDQASVDNYLEQLFIRRELAFNYVMFREGYDAFETMSEPWAYETMEDHKADKREYIYHREDYCAFRTHDAYFNAAMKEMVKTGFMHNYMRMYWGKKIIEWSVDYKTAYETILTLNNTYFIDGRDPVSYASVAWLFGKHDQGWKARKVFGKLRYMNAAGLKRKFDIDAYVKRCNTL